MKISALVDRQRRKRKQNGLMLDVVEEKIRLRAHQFYEEHGREDGHDIDDWLHAESEVLKTSILAPLYRRRSHDRN